MTSAKTDRTSRRPGIVNNEYHGPTIARAAGSDDQDGDPDRADPNSGTMWARVKGEAENAILALPFKAAYVFRPAIVQPLHGITSRTPAYRFFYALFRPLTPVLRALFRNSFATTEQVGRAMLQAARTGAPKKILESADIVRLAKGT